ncbi:hypothetical protein Vadar_019787 [Vaccinium darrowii]|uniref:Uncharacterized protein n=1 Tax=Vaccinium darrowii TaxID=229202 RepID=A0ACB7YWV0_9ERIC|nr:hypothetical protein Vadar_019787 [Vaccinium darrowii]
MGLKNTFNILYPILFFLLLLLLPISSPHEVLKPKAPPKVPSHYQAAFHMQNTHMPFLEKQEHIMNQKKNLRRTRKINVEKITKLDRRPFFGTMLPKGFVPPSGDDSSCQNADPNSVTLDCDLSIPEP